MRHTGGEGTATWRRAAVLAVVTVLPAVLTACGGGGAAAGKVPVPGRETRGDFTGGEWTTVGGNMARTADDAVDPPLAPLTRAWTSPTLDGAVWGEARIFDGEVLAGTENDTVYALSATTGAVLWSRHLATPAPAGALPCGDISPTVGITSTMVVDAPRDELFASGEASVGGAVRHEVFGLDVVTGRQLFDRDVDQPGWDAAAQLQRTGLALSQGHVVVGFGGNDGDCSDYHGWLVGVPESGTGALRAYQVPTEREGAVWAPSGVAVDAAGDVYAATGNGANRPGGAFDFGDAVIELSPSLHVLQYFAPANWAEDNASDADLGSTSPVLLGDGLVFEVGKESTAYLLATSHFGGIGGQVASTDVCAAYGGNAYSPPYVYVGCLVRGVTQVRVGPGHSLTVGWTTSTGGGGAPTVAGGLVWTVDRAHDVLYGLSPSDGHAEVSLPLPPVEHFQAVSAGEGLVVVAGASGVTAFAGPSGIGRPDAVAGATSPG